MYTKIASKSSKNVNLSEKVFLSLENDQVIKNMQVIDKSKILKTRIVFKGTDNSHVPTHCSLFTIESI